MEFLQKEEGIGVKFPSKKEGLGGWREIISVTPYQSSLQRYLEFSFLFSYARPVSSMDEMLELTAKEGDVVKFEDKFFIYVGEE